LNDEQDMKAFEAAMRWNGFNPPERSGWNGGTGYTSARDSDRYHGWRMAQEAAAEEVKRLQAIEAAARNLVKVKGRYHTEQAFKALAALLVNTERSGAERPTGAPSSTEERGTI
jgi:hypothetical protein